VNLLQSKVQDFFEAQTILDNAMDLLTTNLTDTSLKIAVDEDENSMFLAEVEVDKTNIEPTDLPSHIKV